MLWNHFSHRFDLMNCGKKSHFNGGTRIEANKRNFPLLSGMAIYRLELEKEGLREPHWHVNAHELGYCLQGKAVVSIFSPGAVHDRFQVEPGDVFFVPKAYLHSIQSMTSEKSVFILGFSNEEPLEFGMSSIVSKIPAPINAATFNVDPSIFSKIPRFKKDVVVTQMNSSSLASLIEPKSNRYKLKLSGIDPQINLQGGTITLSHKENFSILKELALFDLKLNRGGIREPHWHPNAAELDYVVKGKAKMVILSPEGDSDEFEVQAGDIVFIPQAYYHYIENIGNEEMHFAIFFNHEAPEDIGLSGSLGAYSNDVLAAVFQMDSEQFKDFPKPQQDVFIAPRLL